MLFLSIFQPAPRKNRERLFFGLYRLDYLSGNIILNFSLCCFGDSAICCRNLRKMSSGKWWSIFFIVSRPRIEIWWIHWPIILFWSGKVLKNNYKYSGCLLEILEFSNLIDFGYDNTIEKVTQTVPVSHNLKLLEEGVG